MKRRYRKTNDYRFWFYSAVGLVIFALMNIGVNNFAYALASVVVLMLGFMVFGWLYLGWRLRPEQPDAPAKPIAKPIKPIIPAIQAKAKPKRLIGERPRQVSDTGPVRTKAATPNLQAAIYNAQSPEIRLARLKQMSGAQFEQFVGEIFSKLGYSVGYTGKSGDGGIDLIVRKGAELAAVQCKCYSGTVDAAQVRDLGGVVSKGRYNRGYLITTGSFSAQSRQWVRDTDIVLIDGQRLLEWLDYIEHHTNESRKGADLSRPAALQSSPLLASMPSCTKNLKSKI